MLRKQTWLSIYHNVYKTEALEVCDMTLEHGSLKGFVMTLEHGSLKGFVMTLEQHGTPTTYFNLQQNMLS